jgi:hypothetical protein
MPSQRMPDAPALAVTTKTRHSHDPPASSADVAEQKMEPRIHQLSDFRRIPESSFDML